jgi:hypothetical protein
MSQEKTSTKPDTRDKEAGVLDLGTGKFRKHGEKLEPVTEMVETESECSKKHKGA